MKANMININPFCERQAREDKDSISDDMDKIRNLYRQLEEDNKALLKQVAILEYKLERG